METKIDPEPFTKSRFHSEAGQYGIGAVANQHGSRKQGCASKLMSEVLNAIERGAPNALTFLYSNIKPEFMSVLVSSVYLNPSSATNRQSASLAENGPKSVHTESLRMGNFERLTLSCTIIGVPAAHSYLQGARQPD